jgi:hypothetical protein
MDHNDSNIYNGHHKARTGLLCLFVSGRSVLQLQSIVFVHEQAKSQGAGAGRSSFIPVNPTPGPAAYSPNSDYVKMTAGITAFGTSNRDKEGVRYISEMHSRSLAPLGNPGPGTYR